MSHSSMELPPTSLASMPDRPRGRLLVCFMFLMWTVFSVFVYAKFSTLGDSEAYITGGYGADSEARTQLVTMIASMVQSIVGIPFVVHLVFSAFAASGVLYIVTQGRPHGRAFWILLVMLAMPNFGVWASVVGRESLFVGFLAYAIGATLGYYRRGGLHRIVIALIAVAGTTFIRAPYGMGVGLFVFMFLLYTSAPRTRIGLGTQAMLMAIVGFLVLLGTWPYIASYIDLEVLPEARSYFTVASATTRTWIHVRDSEQLLTGLWWQIPLALIGPTPQEAFSRPSLIPFFISGLTIFGLLGYSIYLSFSRHSVGNVRKILLLGWFPATLIIVVSFVPFGIYNPGSAIRYSASFLLFLIYPPLLLCAAGLQPERASHSARPPHPDQP